MSAEILNFEEQTKKRLVARIVNDFSSLYAQSSEITQSYAELMSNDPLQAIDKLPEFIEKARDINPSRSFVEAMAGGPNQDWIAPLMNVVGIVYPTLDKEIRTKVLSKCLNYLDRLNYFNSQDHVAMLNEPWMVGDVIINRPLYYCGYEEYADLLQKNKTWKELYPQLEITKSAFWLACAVINNKFASKEVKENFYLVFPTLIDRTLDAIAGYNYAYAKNIFEKEGKPIKGTLESEFFAYDPKFYSKLLRKVEERRWIDLKEPSA